MNLYEFQDEVRRAYEEFSESTDQLFRVARENLSVAHDALQTRVGNAKAELFGDMAQEAPHLMSSEEATAYTESFRRSRDI
jgi:hypothetical protein